MKTPALTKAITRWLKRYEYRRDKQWLKQADDVNEAYCIIRALVSKIKNERK